MEDDPAAEEEGACKSLSPHIVHQVAQLCPCRLNLGLSWKQYSRILFGEVSKEKGSSCHESFRAFRNWEFKVFAL